MEKIHRARKGKDWGASIYLLQKHGFPQISKCSPTRCSEHHPCSPYGGFITLTWLIKSSAPGGWTQSSDLPLFLNGLGVRWDWKFQPSGDMIGSTDNQPSSFYLTQKAVINITRETLITLITEGSKVLETLCQKQGWQEEKLHPIHSHLPLSGLSHNILQSLISNTFWKEFRMENKNEALGTLAKIDRTGLPIFRYFQEIWWARSLHLLILSKAWKS